MGTSVLALLWANFGPAGTYDAFWKTYLKISVGDQVGKLSLHHFINDGLMAIFFLLVGLEIKRELLIGELSVRAKAVLPVAAAIGGMVVPALLYALVNLRGGDMRGAGVPMATDIAFSLGVLAMLGSRCPVALKILLAAVAIVDDLGAVLVIAIFYTSQISLPMLGGMAACVAVLWGMNRLGVRTLLPYLGIGLLLWWFTLSSGVHATVAGVLLALMIPAQTGIEPEAFVTEAKDAVQSFESWNESTDIGMITQGHQMAVRELELACEQIQMPLERLEDQLQPWVTYFILPLFAFANAGIALKDGLGSMADPVAIGIMVGLAVGKPLGILLGCGIALKWLQAELPDGVNRSSLVGLGLLTGIGFTMSLFISELAFIDPAARETAKIAILVVSVVMGVLGYAWLRRAAGKSPTVQHA
jgi:NhaA family Na+:H+ antiporter